MLASITPLGERGRDSTWTVTVTAFALGATLGGAVIGATFGALGSLLAPSLGIHGRLGVLAVALGLAAGVDARAPAVPGPRRQVNERWLDEYRGWVYGIGFGAQLGLAVTTVVTSAATYAALLACVLVASPGRGAVIGGLFGLVRGVTPLAAARVSTPPRLLALHHALARLRAPSRWTTVGGLALAAAVALVQGLA